VAGRFARVWVHLMVLVSLYYFISVPYQVLQTIYAWMHVYIDTYIHIPIPIPICVMVLVSLYYFISVPYQVHTLIYLLYRELCVEITIDRYGSRIYRVHDQIIHH
jgi:hypothetical protein